MMMTIQSILFDQNGQTRKKEKITQYTTHTHTDRNNIQILFK